MLLEAGHALLKEAFAPLAHDLAAHIQTRSDLVIAESLRGEEDHLGPEHAEIWQRIFPSTLLEDAPFLGVQPDRKWASPRHPLHLPTEGSLRGSPESCNQNT